MSKVLVLYYSSYGHIERLCSRNLWLSMISDGQGQPLSGFQSSS